MSILMSTHNIGFYEVLTKIIFELSSNTHLISSTAFSKGLIWGSRLQKSVLACDVIKHVPF